MKKGFENFLAKQGYKLTTPGRKPSTVYDYLKRIDKVCEWESTSWEGLANSIGVIVKIYDVGGEKEDFGKKSHRAVINALKRYQEYILSIS